jgi:glycosyltransferase involved in cell wall biosynthesis
MNPEVSVIIPTYNRAEYIEFTLESISRQSFRNWECIVVDDNSDDNTSEIVRKFTDSDERFKLISRHRNPGGAPTCRNIGIEQSRGEYLLFLDSDDILADNCLLNRINFLNNNRDLDFAVFKGLIFHNRPGDTNVLISSNDDYNVIPLILNFDSPWITLNPLFRKTSLLGNNIFWHEGLAGFQDLQFHLLCICKKLKFSYAESEPDCFWRRHDSPDKIGNKLGQLKFLDSNLVYIGLVIKYLKDAGLFSDENARIINKFFLSKALQLINENQSPEPVLSFLKTNRIKTNSELNIERIFFGLVNLARKTKIKLVESIAYRIFFPLYWNRNIISRPFKSLMQKSI